MTPRLHICLICAHGPEAVGGLSAYLRHLAAGLGQTHCVSVIARFTQTSRPSALYAGFEHPQTRDRGAYQTRTIAPSALWRPALTRLTSLVSRPALQPLAQWLYARAYQPALSAALPADLDIVHYVGTGWELLGFAALAEARKRGAAFTIWPAMHPGTWGDSSLDVALYNRADAVFAQSDFERAHLIARGVAPSRLHRCGLAPAADAGGDGARFRQKHKLSQRPLVLFIGRKDGGKGYHALRAAMGRVLAAVPDALLVAIGSDCEPPYPAMPEAALLDLGQTSEAEKADALAACDVFCLPSAQEAFGLVYVEAWACGKPVVGGPAPAVRELITEGVNGFCVDQDSAPIADALIRLLRNPALRRELGRNGQRLQGERYTWNTVLDTHLSVFQGAMARESSEEKTPCLQ